MTPNEQAIEVLNECKQELWDEWHPYMSEGDFENHDLIMGICRSINSLTSAQEVDLEKLKWSTALAVAPEKNHTNLSGEEMVMVEKAIDHLATSGYLRTPPLPNGLEKVREYMTLAHRALLQEAPTEAHGYVKKGLALLDQQAAPVVQFCDGPKKRYAEGLISAADLRAKVVAMKKPKTAFICLQDEGHNAACASFIALIDEMGGE